jgi:peroxiredoxin
VIGLSIAKLTAGFVALSLIAACTWLFFGRRQAQTASSRVASSQPERTFNATGAGSPTQAAARPETAAKPDPMKLLQGVVRARQRIASGSISFTAEAFHPPQKETNRWLLAAVFDGAKRRFDQAGHEYAYTYDSDPDKAAEIRIKADAFGADREGAVRAGLLKEFTSHYATTYDGSALLRYWETDAKPESATIEDASGGCGQYVFDPRCLGLSSQSWITLDIDKWLSWLSTRSVEMAGQEVLDGVVCWHLRISAEQDQADDLWLDVARPTCVLKLQSGSTITTSRYETGARTSPIPAEVVSTAFHDGLSAFGTRLVQTAAEFNTIVDPATFTLAGLGMKIGTAVSDIRIHRTIGYWTGAGLSDNLPPKKKPAPAEDEPRLEDMLAILDNTDPVSDEAFDASQWILLNTPDGPAVERAAAVILHEHVKRPDLASFCQQLQRIRHRSAGELIEAILKENPIREVRAVACFELATLRKDQCKYGEEKKLSAEADGLFTRVINEFSQAGPTSADLSRKAKVELSELRRMSIGKPAPNFDGIDLNGQRFRLSDLRGKVVVVVFWEAGSTDVPQEHQNILAAFAGRPVAWIGIYCEDQLGKAAELVEKGRIPGPVILDGRSGPIADNWSVQSWPTVFMMDSDGIIRSRNARGQALAKAVAELVPK